MRPAGSGFLRVWHGALGGYFPGARTCAPIPAPADEPHPGNNVHDVRIVGIAPASGRNRHGVNEAITVFIFVKRHRQVAIVHDPPAPVEIPLGEFESFGAAVQTGVRFDPLGDSDNRDREYWGGAICRNLRISDPGYSARGRIRVLSEYRHL